MIIVLPIRSAFQLFNLSLLCKTCDFELHVFLRVYISEGHSGTVTKWNSDSVALWKRGTVEQ